MNKYLAWSGLGLVGLLVSSSSARAQQDSQVPDLSSGGQLIDSE